MEWASLQSIWKVRSYDCILEYFAAFSKIKHVAPRVSRPMILSRVKSPVHEGCRWNEEVFIGFRWAGVIVTALHDWTLSPMTPQGEKIILRRDANPIFFFEIQKMQQKTDQVCIVVTPLCAIVFPSMCPRLLTPGLRDHTRERMLQVRLLTENNSLCFSHIKAEVRLHCRPWNGANWVYYGVISKKMDLGDPSCFRNVIDVHWNKGGA